MIIQVNIVLAKEKKKHQWNRVKESAEKAARVNRAEVR